MRIFLWILGIVGGGLAVLIAGVYLWIHIKYPTYTYRYRLTIALETDGQVHTGSSVIEVELEGGIPFGDVGPYSPRERGEAAVVDLGTRGVVVATLGTEHGAGRAPDGAMDTRELVPLVFGRGRHLKEYPDLPRLQGRRDLTSDNMPRLIWFPNRDDPAAGRKFTIKDIPDLFGPNARLTRAYVEITRDPIVIDIDKKFPWYKAWADPYRIPGSRDRKQIKLSDGTGISPYMFVGDAS